MRLNCVHGMKIYTINPGLQFIREVDPHLSSEDPEPPLHDLNGACFYVSSNSIASGLNTRQWNHTAFAVCSLKTSDSEHWDELCLLFRDCSCFLWLRLETSTSFWLNPELSSSRSVCVCVWPDWETQLLFGQHTLPTWHGHLIAAKNLNRQLNEVFQRLLWRALVLIHNIANIGC